MFENSAGRAVFSRVIFMFFAFQSAKRMSVREFWFHAMQTGCFIVNAFQIIMDWKRSFRGFFTHFAVEIGVFMNLIRLEGEVGREVGRECGQLGADEVAIETVKKVNHG